MRHIFARLDDIPERLDDIPERLDDIPARLDDIPARLDDIPARLDDIPARLDDIPARLDDIPARVSHNKTRIARARRAWRVRNKESIQEYFPLLGTTGEKKWVDETIVSGTAFASYYVVAQRGNLKSEASEPVGVLFGAQQHAA